MEIEQGFIRINKYGSRQGLRQIGAITRVLIREYAACTNAHSVRDRWDSESQLCGHYIIDSECILQAIPNEERARCLSQALTPSCLDYCDINDGLLCIYLVPISPDGKLTDKQYLMLKDLLVYLKSNYQITSVKSLFEATGANQPRDFSMNSKWEEIKKQI